MTDRARSGLGV